MVPARTTLSLGEILLKLTTDPNQRTSVLLAFNCKCFAAHQWLTSVKQLVRVDAIRGTSAGGPCVIGKQMIEKFVLLQYTCDIFGILDKLFRSKYRASRNAGLQGYWNRLTTTSSDCLCPVLQKISQPASQVLDQIHQSAAALRHCIWELCGRLSRRQRKDQGASARQYAVDQRPLSCHSWRRRLPSPTNEMDDRHYTGCIVKWSEVRFVSELFFVFKTATCFMHFVILTAFTKFIILFLPG